MASIVRYDTKRSGPRWRVMWRYPNGRQTTDTFIDYMGALDFKDKVEQVGGDAAREIRDRRLGSPGLGKIPILAAALEDHIDNLTGVTDGTRDRYWAMARNSFADLDNLPVDAIDRDAVNKWAERQSRTVSEHTVRNRHGLLHGALERQVELGNIRSNPARRTKISRTERGGIVFLTPDEFAQVYDHMPTYWQPLTAILYGTGLRFGEATALQVRDLALDDPEPTLRVERAWKWTGTNNPQLGPPKSKKGRRTLVLPPELVRVLRPLVDDKPRDALVFTTARGQSVRNGDYRRGGWVKALAGARLAKRPRIHDLRHSYAAAQITEGTSLPLLQYCMGHEQITTTIDTYGHIAETTRAVAAQAASRALSLAMPELLPGN